MHQAIDSGGEAGVLEGAGGGGVPVGEDGLGIGLMVCGDALPDGGGDLRGHEAEAAEVVMAVVVGVAEFGLADAEVGEGMPCVEHADFGIPACSEGDLLKGGAAEAPFARESVAEFAEVGNPWAGGTGGRDGLAERLDEEAEEAPVELAGVAAVPAFAAVEAGFRVEDGPAESGEEIGGVADDVGVVGGHGEDGGVGEGGAAAEPESAAFARGEVCCGSGGGFGTGPVVPEDFDVAGEVTELAAGGSEFAFAGGVESDDEAVEPWDFREGLADASEGRGTEFAGVAGQDESEGSVGRPCGEVAVPCSAGGSVKERQRGDRRGLEEIGHGIVLGGSDACGWGGTQGLGGFCGWRRWV